MTPVLWKYSPKHKTDDNKHTIRWHTVQRQACFQNNYFILYTAEKEVTIGTDVII